MFRIFRLFKTLSIPDSKGNQYNFDPKLMGFGSRVFDQNQTQGKVSQEEFDSLRQKMISAGGSDLSAAKCLLITMCITFPVGFIAFIVRLVLRFTGTYMSTPELIIYIACCLIPNIIIGCAFSHYSRKACQAIQAMLNQENRNYFSSRGVSFKISSGLKYVTLTFQYNPNGVGNVNQPGQGYTAPPVAGYNSNINYSAQTGYPGPAGQQEYNQGNQAYYGQNA